MAWVHAMAGQKDRVARLLVGVVARPSRRHLPFTSLAAIRMALGDTHRALGDMEAACLANEWYVLAFHRHCSVDRLRMARFRSALSAAGYFGLRFP